MEARPVVIHYIVIYYAAQTEDKINLVSLLHCSAQSPYLFLPVENES